MSMAFGTKHYAVSCASLLALFVLLATPSAAHAQRTSVLSPSSGSATVEKRHLGRIASSFRKAVEGNANFVVSPTSCRLNNRCIAAAGKEQGSARALGIWVTRKRDSFTLNLLLVEAATGRVVSQAKVLLEKRDLPSSAGAAILRFLVDGTGTSPSPVAASPNTKISPVARPQPLKLKVQVAKSVSGDGVGVVPVKVLGSPAPRAGELKRFRERPVLSCEGASTLPAFGDQAPALLAPAVSTPTTVTCNAEHRDAIAQFSVQFVPPEKGLRAKPDRFRVFAGEEGLELLVSNGRSPASGALRVATSAGEATVLGEGRVRLTLPTGKAPRTIAMVLGDGADAGVAFVPVIGKTKLRVVAQKGATVVVRIAGTAFGPKRTRRRVTPVAIEVPPGVRRAVVRATDRKGYAIESVSDLRIPQFPRIAALAPSKPVVILESTEVYVALASADGRPAGPSTKISATADRGRVQGTRYVSPGLFAIQYQAPETPGDVQLTVGQEGDAGAGSASVSLAIAAGKALAGEITLAPGPYLPGSVLSGSVVFRDAEGNPIREGMPVASLGGIPVAVTNTASGFQFQATVPNKLPANKTFALEVALNKTSLSHSIRAKSDVPTVGKLRSSADGRVSELIVVVRDRHGNLADATSFELRVDGARRGVLRERKNRFELELIAEGKVRSASVDIFVGDQLLAHSQVPFDPPPGALLLGAYARGAWASNLAGVSPPHLGVGLGIRRVGTLFEVSAFAGVESYAHSDSITANLAGAERNVERAVLAIALPVQLRARLRITRILGLHASGGLVPTMANVTIETDFQAADSYRELTFGVRGLVGADLRLGPGRLLIGGAYTRTKLSDGLLTGNLEGISLSAGYEWWFAEVLR